MELLLCAHEWMCAMRSFHLTSMILCEVSEMILSFSALPLHLSFCFFFLFFFFEFWILGAFPHSGSSIQMLLTLLLWTDCFPVWWQQGFGVDWSERFENLAWLLDPREPPSSDRGKCSFLTRWHLLFLLRSGRGVTLNFTSLSCFYRTRISITCCFLSLCHRVPKGWLSLLSLPQVLPGLVSTWGFSSPFCFSGAALLVYQVSDLSSFLSPLGRGWHSRG